MNWKKPSHCLTKRLNTKSVYCLTPADDGSIPSIDFSRKENRGYNWSAIQEMIDGVRQIDANLSSSIDIKVQLTSTPYDCLSMNAHLLISKVGRQMFEKTVPGDCCFIPLKINGTPVFLVLVRRIIDALDCNRSELEFFRTTPDQVMTIRKYRFRKDTIPDPAVFRIPEHRLRVFVTDGVKEAIERWRLVGFKLVDFENPPVGTYIS